MQLVAPDILAEVVRLSPGACFLGFVAGLALAVTGLAYQRFWVALIATAGCGLWGLQSGRAAGSHPLVAGLLVAIAAGFLALEVSKLIAFLTGGLTAAIAAQYFVPAGTDPLLVYLTGGLAAVLLYRLWMLTLTGFSGALLAAYCGLALLARVLKWDAVALATNKVIWLNAVVAIGALVSLIVQSRYEKRLSTTGERQRKKAMSVLSTTEREAVEKAQKSAKPRLWGLLGPKPAA